VSNDLRHWKWEERPGQIGTTNPATYGFEDTVPTFQVQMKLAVSKHFDPIFYSSVLIFGLIKIPALGQLFCSKSDIMYHEKTFRDQIALI
jgi:hypothetical protein